MTASTESSTQSHHDEKEAIAPARLVAYALGNFGQSAFYNALSTYFVVYVTNSLFSGVDKAVAQAHRHHHLADRDHSYRGNLRGPAAGQPGG